MRRLLKASLLIALLLCGIAGSTAAQSTRSTPAIQEQFSQSLAAVEAKQYLQATQLLTRLVGLPEHVHSERAQELLGNVREANGQIAHAVAEYKIYLSKYPDGPGASRVSLRLNTLLAGSAPVVKQPDAAALVRDRTSASRTSAQRPMGLPARTRFGRDSRATEETATDSDARTIVDRGSVQLVYRYNEGTTQITQLSPDPIPDITEEESDVFNNALTAVLGISRVIDDKNRRVTLSFSGSHTIDFENDQDNQFRLYELLVSIEDKQSGRILTFGRQKLRPRGIAYRMDGASLKFPIESGAEIGIFAGSPVDSTRDIFFGRDDYFFGLSATLPKGMVGPGELSAYLFEQRKGSYTDRRALGLEYSLDLDNSNVFANAEVDLKLGQLNRALLTGSRVLPNNGRVTARLGFYRSPHLSLENALIGQTATSISQLNTVLTSEEIEDLALARTAKVTTLGMTYYGPLNEKWNMSAFVTLYDTSGKPATTGIPGVDDVAAVASDGVRSYLGVEFIGSSIFWPNDQLSIGGRYANSDDSDLFVASTSMRVPVSEKLMVRPSLRIGYRDETAGSSEKFVIPSVFARYKMSRQTNLQFEFGGKWSDDKSSTRITKQNQFFVSGGLSRSF